MHQLTERQQQIVDWLKRYQRQHGFPPTRLELARGVGFKEGSSITPHLAALAKAGWIRIHPNTKRGIRVLDDLPVVGPVVEIAAGTPLLAKTYIVQRLPTEVADLFRPRPDYLLTVRGDSMELAGIHDNDFVAIHRTHAPESGQIVVARFGDEVTLKRYVRLTERRVELRPESRNPAHQVMELDLAKHRLEIDGVAVGAVMTKMRDAEPEARLLWDLPAHDAERQHLGSAPLEPDIASASGRPATSGWSRSSPLSSGTVDRRGTEARRQAPNPAAGGRLAAPERESAPKRRGAPSPSCTTSKLVGAVTWHSEWEDPTTGR